MLHGKSNRNRVGDRRHTCHLTAQHPRVTTGVVELKLQSTGMLAAYQCMYLKWWIITHIHTTKFQTGYRNAFRKTLSSTATIMALMCVLFTSRTLSTNSNMTWMQPFESCKRGCSLQTMRPCIKDELWKSTQFYVFKDQFYNQVSAVTMTM